MAAVTVTLGGTDLATLGNGFVLQSYNRVSGGLRNVGVALPGVSGYQNQLTMPWDRDPVDLVLTGKIRGDSSALRTAVLGTKTWRSLVFSDLSPKYYTVLGKSVDEALDRTHPAFTYVSIVFAVSPPCFLGATVTDSSSPVANAGDLPCPATWTITAAGNFTLTVGTVSCAWTGGAGTVVINSETFEVTLGGVSAPQYLMGGYPWLLPGNNTVTLTAGSTFSCAFNPRYA